MTFLKSPWFLGGLAALVLFALSFWAINYVGSPDEEQGPKVEKQVIATLETNPELIGLARAQGWIKPEATEMTSIDALHVDSIGAAFQGCNLKTFDEFRFFVGLKELPEGAFAHSDALTSIVIPAYIEDIKYGALAYCPNLQSISVDTANTHYDSRQDCNAVVCTWKGKLMVVAGCRNTVIPSATRYLAPQAFCGISGLKTITFPERFDEIGEQAFKDCADLTAVDIPQGVRFIEPETFAGCRSLTTVKVPKSVERLKKDAFAGCASLTTMVMPKKYAPILLDAFDGSARGLTVCVPKGAVPTYRKAKGWAGFKGSIKEIQ